MSAVLRFDNVVKSFGERVVLNGISFEVNQGEILFILGTSGTGKSVLLKNIVGLLTPDSGEIWVGSQEVSRLREEDFAQVRKMCGMVFQQPALFDSLTVFDNIAFGLRKHYQLSPSEISKKVFRALDLVHLHGIEGRLPQEISFGMQKRVSLARTIAMEPEILLFDEPTTGLDPVTTNAINQLILDLSRELKTTSVVVSHDMHCALDIADKIIVLDKGEIIESGGPEELKRSTKNLVQEFLAETLGN